VAISSCQGRRRCTPNGWPEVTASHGVRTASRVLSPEQGRRNGAGGHCCVDRSGGVVARAPGGFAVEVGHVTIYRWQPTTWFI
jgi:hypothetical protein